MLLNHVAPTEFYSEAIEAVAPSMRLDDLLSIAWKFKKVDETMPYAIKEIGNIYARLNE